MEANLPSGSETLFAQIQQALRDLSCHPKGFERTMSAVALVVKAMSVVGLEPIVVGGQALELYTFGSYTTSDVDIVLSGRERAAEVLERIGFEKKAVGFRHWVHAALDLPIEIPDAVLFGSMDKLSEVDIDGNLVKVIGIEDLILDRLRAGVYWKSESDMTWARYLITSYAHDLDVDYLTQEAKKPENDVAHALSTLLAEVQQPRARRESGDL